MIELFARFGGSFVAANQVMENTRQAATCSSDICALTVILTLIGCIVLLIVVLSNT